MLFYVHSWHNNINMQSTYVISLMTYSEPSCFLDASEALLTSRLHHLSPLRSPVDFFVPFIEHRL